MTSPALAARFSGLGAGTSATGYPLWVLTVAALAGFVAFTVVTGGMPQTGSYADSDDVMRMVQVRQLLAGASWFDTTIPTFGGEAPLVSHWSRLVDLPLAVLIAAFGLVSSPDSAELAARIVWPLALFAGLLWIVAHAASERAGHPAAIIALLLSVLCLSGTMQFAPGRIDHHNAMILAAVAGTLLTVHSLAKPRTGWLAGAVLGLGTAVGYEALLLTIATLTAAGLLAVVTGTGRSGVRRVALAFSATLTLVYFATTAPADWFDARCDALSLNLVMLASTASIGLVASLHMRPLRTLEVRLAALAATAITAIALFAVVEPACMRGPFGQVDPRLWPLWLDNVRETQSLFWLAATVPLVVLVYVAQLGLGIFASVRIARADGDRQAELYTAVLVLWALASFWQAKLMPYAAFLAIPGLAAGLARIEGSPSVSAAIARFAATAGASQPVLLVAAALLFGTGGTAAGDFADDANAKRACTEPASIAPLASLPAGLVAAQIDLGPFVGAATPHPVFAAPYHRLDRQIVEMYDLLAAEPGEAERRLRRIGARYVVLCGAQAVPAEAGQSNGFRHLLLTGRAPAFVEPVSLPDGSPLRVWRIK